MAVVEARSDLHALNGKFFVAKKGQHGTALRGIHANIMNYYKVPVRWDGRQKVYWHFFEDLDFISSPLDPVSYIVTPPGQILDLPALPQLPDTYTFHFGQNLRQYRKERKMAQWRIAKLMRDSGIRVSQTAISQWERNEHAPNGIYVYALSRALNVPVFMFFINARDCTWMRRMRDYIIKLVDMSCEESIG